MSSDGSNSTFYKKKHNISESNVDLDDQKIKRSYPESFLTSQPCSIGGSITVDIPSLTPSPHESTASLSFSFSFFANFFRNMQVTWTFARF
ncbi:uncharacterized protein LOC112468260 isoform X2 [Temnothorax curvispinosus]|uniref:Uncharacterized protein LOC112468260 isoform X2 n=1 Tax=Temnothorax curvispinosus TaxID=300111 RepID=A0A6J1RK59_9HYME|nr:uncharacterized protein LOC112468260 isoform X2 [Temnothorax curvispinosus]